MLDIISLDVHVTSALPGHTKVILVAVHVHIVQKDTINPILDVLGVINALLERQRTLVQHKVAAVHDVPLGITFREVHVTSVLPENTRAIQGVVLAQAVQKDIINHRQDLLPAISALPEH